MTKPILSAIPVYLIFTITCSGIAQNSIKDTEISYDQREVTFNNGDITLAATLLLPKNIAHAPAVVIIHGSGASGRSNPWTTAYAKALAERGIVVLHPDKRGSGDSEGDWRTSGFRELADDAIAGVEFLRDRAEVDSAYIGVIGFSQGGHVAPVAAARSSKVAFAISVSSSVVPLITQMIDEVEIMAEREELTREQIAEVNVLHELGFRYAMTGKGWDEYHSALVDLKNGPVGGSDVVTGFPPVPDHWAWQWLQAVGYFDPLPYWGQLDIPVLFMYGGQDTQIRVKRSIDLIEQKLGSLNYTLMLFNRNGHAHFRQDALDFTARWIRDKGVN